MDEIEFVLIKSNEIYSRFIYFEQFLNSDDTIKEQEFNMLIADEAFSNPTLRIELENRFDKKIASKKFIILILFVYTSFSYFIYSLYFLSMLYDCTLG